MVCTTGITPNTRKDKIGAAANWQAKYRDGWSGLYATFNASAGANKYKAHNSFWTKVDSTFLNLNHIAYYHSNPQLYIEWIGHVGWWKSGCTNSLHTQLRAFDLSVIDWVGSGGKMDTNHAWRGTSVDKKRYAAVCATIRIQNRTVLTHKYNSLHRDHIHFDNGNPSGQAVPALRTSSRADICIMQYLCNYIAGYGTTVDGYWGPQTSSHMNSLKHALGLGCKNPFTSFSSMASVLTFAAYHGFRNKPLGYYVSSACPGPY